MQIMVSRKEEAMKKFAAGYILFILLIFILFTTSAKLFLAPDKPALYKDRNGISCMARTSGKEFQFYGPDGKWENTFMTGVNIGMGKPGYYPGEFAVTKDEFLRWFAQIGEMNSSVIRVYVPQKPEFYDALLQYNRTSKKPLYLIQGVYVNEKEAEHYENVYAEDSSLQDEFRKDIKDAVQMIHGDANIPEQTGRAWGSYRSDVSSYVAGFILGIEWSADLVKGTNKANPDKTEFAGKYVRTKNASPFEIFLAETAEYTVSFETEHYQMQRPVALSNWPTTDPLSHPNEPLKAAEDAVSVDTEHILSTDAFMPGFFASYHVYPYYPDFMSYDTKYQKEGSNPYREYLKELNAWHSVPLLISEFGVPTSRGMTHRNDVLGYHHGHLTEEAQGKAVASMLKDIHDTGCAGGIVFSWQDEWFKTTWNTKDLDLPDRRALWPDVQTSEQSYGILTFDPSHANSTVKVDGSPKEWTEKDLILKQGDLKLSARSDEAYLYLLVKDPDFSKTDRVPLYLPLDTIQGQGNSAWKKLRFERPADFLLKLDGPDNSALKIDPYYNTNYKLYTGNIYGEKEWSRFIRKNSGVFEPIEQLLNRRLYLPETKEWIPFRTFPTGRLIYGITDPESPDYNSLADFYAKDGYVEIRLPWLLLNVKDPSSGKIIGNLHEGDGIPTETASAFYLGLGTEGQAEPVTMKSYSLPSYDTPTYTERLKKSYPLIQNAFSAYHKGGPGPLYKLSLNMRSPLFWLFAMLISLLVYLFIACFFVQIRRNSNHKKKLTSRNLGTYGGMTALHGFLLSADPSEADNLSAWLMTTSFHESLKKALKKRNSDYRNLAAKLAGMLRRSDTAPLLYELLKKYPGDDVFQYNAMLALSLMGEGDYMNRLFQDENYPFSLSFRCFLEILRAYNGNPEALYRNMMKSPSVFVTRVAVKQAGSVQMNALAPVIAGFLETDSESLLIDTIRALGQLKYNESEDKIAAYTSHSRWEVRYMALNALFSMNSRKCRPLLRSGLADPEWQVRRLSAELLEALKQST